MKYSVVKFENSHEWLRDNVFIRTGYRKNCCNIKHILKSCCEINNEVLNIWTHLIGTIMVIILSLLLPNLIKVKCLSYAPAYIVYFVIFKVLLLSTLFHLFSSHSERVFFFLQKCDHFGILLSISISSVCFYYYGFYEYPFYFYIYSIL